MDLEEINWEIARDIISALFAKTATEIYNLKFSYEYSAEKVKLLEDRLRLLYREKFVMSPEIIEKALNVYAEELRNK